MFPSCPLRGIVPPLVTPLCDGAALDVPALHRVIDRVLAGGVHGVLLLGSTGEFASLTVNVRREMISESCSYIAGRVPVIVNVSSTCLAESLELAEQAARAGAAALSISPPYYFPMHQLELQRYIRRFCDRVTLPVWLYNIPKYAHTPFGTDTVRSLVELPNIVGIKNSSGSIQYLRTIRRVTSHRPEFSLLVGNEETLLPAMDAGAHGGVCGGANVFPGLFVSLYETASNGRHTEAELLQSLIARIGNDIYTVGPASSSYLRGLKYALQSLGVCGDTVAAPFDTFTPPEKSQIDERLQKLLRFLNNSGLIRK
ncbi:MAG: dihydrodipicolinate synthase family protein [Bryobacteraceae bacterium]